MVIEENENANYLAHYKTKGAKNGIRRFQSYLVQPNPSGATGQEVGEAAEQRQRITGHDERRDDQNQNEYRREEGGDRNASMQRLQDRVAPRKKTAAEILQDRKKKKWAKSYRSLYKHADSFSNKELNDAITRLDLKDRIRNKHLSSLARNTQDGSNALRNIAQGSASMLSIYNALALGVNAYNTYKGAGKKNLPTVNTGLIGLGGGGGGGNKDKKKEKKDDAFIGPYIEHFGVPGQKWFKRHFQSYKTAPTRSGKVGEEIGLAAKQAERLGEYVDTDEVFKKDITEFKNLIKNKMIETESDVKYGQNMSQDHQKSADLGLNALDRMGDYNIGYEDHYRNEADHYRQGIRDWFVFEDQTIGMFTIANMVRKGATKQQINKLIDTAEEANGFKFNDETGHYERKHGEEEYEYMPGIFQLSEGNWNDRLRSFADACLKEYEENKTEYFKVVGPQKKKLI